MKVQGCFLFFFTVRVLTPCQGLEKCCACWFYGVVTAADAFARPMAHYRCRGLFLLIRRSLSPAPSCKSDRPEYDLAGRVYSPTGSSPHFVVAKARTLPLPSLQLFIGKGPPALQASLVPCAQLRSTRFPHSFRFPSASSSRHLSSFLCQTVPIWNRLPSSVISSTSLSSFRSAVRRHFVSDMFTYGLS